jgi:hypothetical protein
MRDDRLSAIVDARSRRPEAIAEAAAARGRLAGRLDESGHVLAMVEPFLGRRAEGRVRVELTPEAVIRASVIAAGLRSLLYPPGDDVAAAVDAAVGLLPRAVAG